MWTQIFSPLASPWTSAAVAAAPIALLLYVLVVRRAAGVTAGAMTLGGALLIAIAVYRMPPELAVLAALQGAVYGLFPISWIVFSAVLLYQVTVQSGRFEILKQSIGALTDDRRLQAMLIAFGFGAFLEGCAGFGAPVAISAGMLVGLGFDARYAAGLCLIANTAPVAFGSIGIPLVTASQVTGLDLHDLSRMVGRQLPLLSLVVPAYLVVLMAGWRGLREVWPAALTSGGVFALAQYLTSNYLGPLLPDIISSTASIAALLLRVWRPQTTFRFPHESVSAVRAVRPSRADAVSAWTPFVVLTMFIAAWGAASVQAVLGHVTVVAPVPLLDNAIVNPDTGRAIAAVVRLNWLSAAGTSVVLAALASALLLRMPWTDMRQVCARTGAQLARPALTIALFLAFAYVSSASGMTTTLGRALAGTGALFPAVSPLLGWLGVFITGSDTSANALFGKLQQTTAEQLGLSPVLAVAANSSGGVTAKMISPQSIAVACAATGLTGREPDLLRFTLPHSLVMVLAISAMTWLQATWLSWMVPAGEAGRAATAAPPSAIQGWLILAGLALALLALALAPRGRAPMARPS